jgi:hypothetical protein
LKILNVLVNSWEMMFLVRDRVLFLVLNGGPLPLRDDGGLYNAKTSSSRSAIVSLMVVSVKPVGTAAISVQWASGSRAVAMNCAGCQFGEDSGEDFIW